MTGDEAFDESQGSQWRVGFTVENERSRRAAGDYDERQEIMMSGGGLH